MGMSERLRCEIYQGCLAEHPAVQAWSRLGPDRVQPEAVEALKLKRKSAVYRLSGVGPDGCAIVAKKCLRRTALIERVLHEEYLPGLAVPALRFYGFVDQAASEFCWLFLEDASAERYSLENSDHRVLAGHWLATVQAAAVAEKLVNHLPRRGPEHYLDCLRKSRATVLEHLA